MHIRPELFPVFGAVLHPVDPLIQPLLHAGGVFGDLIPFQVEGIVAVVISLRIGGMAGEWNVADGIHDEIRDDGAVGVGADDGLIDDLFRGDDDMLWRQKRLPSARR